MAEFLESDYKRVVDSSVRTRFVPGTSIEIVREIRNGRPPEHALFDFDGTLSLVREGWPDVMVPLMVEVLRQTGTSESPQALRDLAQGFVMQLNGKQTIYQMIRLAEEVAKRGGRPLDPVRYKDMYHERLMDRIRSRREDLRSGKARPEDMLVPGSLDLLGALRDRGVKVYLASGTDEAYVKEEAALLGLDRFFGERLYGAIADYKAFSKAHVIDRILKENGVEGASLIGFGDGYVEIENIKSVGGIAVAVASDEAGRSGKPDPWKRDRLIGVGADAVIPDFREHRQIVACFWEGEGRA
jgi:phosphoglycolate phosphatase-like HAD superfamily hydrolase